MAVDYSITESNRRPKIFIKHTEKEKSGDMLKYTNDDWEVDYLEYKKELGMN